MTTHRCEVFFDAQPGRDTGRWQKIIRLSKRASIEKSARKSVRFGVRVCQNAGRNKVDTLEPIRALKSNIAILCLNLTCLIPSEIVHTCACGCMCMYMRVCVCVWILWSTQAFRLAVHNSQAWDQNSWLQPVRGVWTQPEDLGGASGVVWGRGLCRGSPPCPCQGAAWRVRAKVHRTQCFHKLQHSNKESFLQQKHLFIEKMINFWRVTELKFGTHRGWCHRAWALRSLIELWCCITPRRLPTVVLLVPSS